MIATSSAFWMAFFDPTNINHQKARNSVKIYDKEQIVINTTVITEITNWLVENEKHALASWFLDYVTNTANVKIFYIGKEELNTINGIINDKQTTFSDAILHYLQIHLHCDITKEY